MCGENWGGEIGGGGRVLAGWYVGWGSLIMMYQQQQAERILLILVISSAHS